MTHLTALPDRPPHITFERVDKTYPGASALALDGISFNIARGEVFGIIGRSGAGKSSLLRTINGLEKPTSGQVLVDGVDVGTLSTQALVGLRRRIGMIFQHFNLLSAKTVWENVALPLKVAGVPAAEIAQRVDALLALVGLEGKQHVYPGRLSGGQKQRVGIARALVHRPEILLCDEATSALDPETTDAILALLRDINRRLGLTIVLITHEMGVIRDICDNVLVLEAGRVAEQGPVWRVFGDPQHDATRALLQPLRGGLPDDVAARLQPAPPTRGAFEQLIELGYTGTAAVPELAQIAQALRYPTRLLRADLDRIQGRTQGRLLIAAAGGALSQDALAALQLSQSTRSLGYVPAHD